MCLYIAVGSDVKIAEKDIVVYKLLHTKNVISTNGTSLDGISFHGKKFTGEINSDKCSGKISINESGRVYLCTKSGRVYLCTNNTNLSGDKANNRLGFTYSWWADSAVKSIIVDGVEIVSERQCTIYQNSIVECGKTYTSELVCDFDRVDIGLHSFANLKVAKREKAPHQRIAKCIIPKGSKYYKGMFGMDKSYASDTLKYIEIIN